MEFLDIFAQATVQYAIKIVAQQADGIDNVNLDLFRKVVKAEIELAADRLMDEWAELAQSLLNEPWLRQAVAAQAFEIGKLAADAYAIEAAAEVAEAEAGDFRLN